MDSQPPRKPPSAPVAYRPQPVPRILQTKRNSARAQPLAAKLSAHRSGKASGSKPSPLPIPVRLNPVIQRAAAKAAPQGAAGGGSGRDAGTLWDLFASYRPPMAKEVIAAFTKAGYTVANMGKEIKKAIKTRGLDIPAHGFGVAGGAVQGGLDTEARNWVTQLTAWAAAHPAKAGGGGGGGGGLRHTPAEAAAARREKLEEKMEHAKAKKQDHCEENGHAYKAFGEYRMCTNCGHLEGDD